MARLLPSIHTLENPIVHVVAKLNSVGAISDQTQQLALNAAARGLLDHHVSKDVSKGWRYAALTGIETVCKTFDLAPTESERALISLVTPQRLAHFPQEDLFELAHQIKHLNSSGEDVVLRLFEAAFSAGPKPGDWQNFGGAIMPMRMQTSDHWNSIHYSLAGYYEGRDGTNAALMTELACIAWRAVVCRRTTRHNSSLKEPANAELFRLREALKLFIERDDSKIDVIQMERRWRVIGQCERALRRYRRRYPKMAEDLWGHLVGACKNVVRHAEWPATSKRWKTVRRILLKATRDSSPKPSDNGDVREDQWPTSGWPAPRLDAAQGLPFLAYRLGRADRAITNALRKLCRDKSLPLRLSLAERLAMLEKPASAVMWELIDIFVSDEKKFSVLHAVLLSLDRLWSQASDKVRQRLRILSQRTMRSAPADEHIYETLTQMHLFRFLRTGDSECEEFIKGLIEECDSQPASHALESQLHTCRAGGWLTAGDGLKPDAHADAARTRTWSFISRLLTAAQEKLHSHRERWRQLHADAEATKAVQQSIERAVSLVASPCSSISRVAPSTRNNTRTKKV